MKHHVRVLDSSILRKKIVKIDQIKKLNVFYFYFPIRFNRSQQDEEKEAIKDNVYPIPILAIAYGVVGNMTPEPILTGQGTTKYSLYLYRTFQQMKKIKS